MNLHVKPIGHGVFFFERGLIRPVVLTLSSVEIVKVPSHINITDTVLVNIIDRIAEALGFDIPSAKGFSNMAEVLLKKGC